MLERLTDQEMADVALVVEDTLKLGYKAIEFAIRKHKESAKKAAENFQQTAPQVFKGNIYDLSYFWGYDTLPFSVIEEIPLEVRQGVKQSFDELQQQGYVTAQNNCVVLTEKGKTLIDDPSFIRSALQDRCNGLEDIKKILDQEYKRRIAERGIANQPTQNVQATPNSPVINYHDNLVTNTSEIVAEAGEKVTEKTVSASMRQPANIGAQQAAQQAAHVAAQTAQKGVATGAKAGVQAGTSAAAGAATMGAATAAQIGYELAQGAIKIIKEKTLK